MSSDPTFKATTSLQFDHHHTNYILPSSYTYAKIESRFQSIQEPGGLVDNPVIKYKGHRQDMHTEQCGLSQHLCSPIHEHRDP